MQRFLAPVFALCVACALAACAGASSTSRLVEPGVQKAGRLTLQSEMEWTRASAQRFQMWTIDGELLNLLYLVPEVREGDYIFLGARQSKRRPDGPYYHPGMREDEIRDLITDGLLGAGFIGVDTSNLRPSQFGEHEGMRFDIAMANPEGLAYQGYVAAFEHERGLALAIFIAPREYYFPRDGAKVSKMLDTLRWQK